MEQRDVQSSTALQQPQAQGERLCLLIQIHTGLHKLMIGGIDMTMRPAKRVQASETVNGD